MLVYKLLISTLFERNIYKSFYNKLKRYWKLFPKHRLDINYTDHKRFVCFSGLMCEEDVINYLLDIDNELKDTYELY